MAGPVTFKIEGLSQCDEALGTLKKATAKAVLRRVGKKALEPMADAAERFAPVLTGHLRDSITTGTKLTRRQARLNKADPPEDFVSIFMGPNNPAAVPQEFGTFDQPAQPFMRPAFELEAEPTIMRVRDLLKPEIDKTIQRAAARALKLAAKG